MANLRSTARLEICLGALEMLRQLDILTTIVPGLLLYFQIFIFKTR